MLMNILLWLVHGMYTNACNPVYVDEGYSQEFEVKLGASQGFVIRLVLFIIVLEALSCEFLSQVSLQCLFGVFGL